MKKLLPIILILFTLNIFSQKEANFWYFGNRAALDFNSGVPVPVGGSELNTTEGCSSFSDANGNLLFYVGAPSPTTNNLTIWGKDNVPMPNGTGLQGDTSSSQSALTVPAPGQPNIYYLFVVGAPSSSNQGFWFYTIDMTLNGGNGDVVGSATDLSQGNSNLWSEKVTAVRANNCNEFWVISFRRPNLFYAYKVNSSGVDIANPRISTINNYNINFNGSRGYLKVSPNGKILVAANMNDDTFIFNFDDLTGEVSNFNNTATPSQLNTNGNNGYGVEFSASSSRLYVSTGNFGGATENLFQFDVTQANITDINASRFTVHSYFNTRGALQLGPNAKIYWASDNSNNISVINNPEELGAAVNYAHQSVNIGSGAVVSRQGLPPFLSSLLLPIEIKDADTNEVINNQDLKLCTAENITIIPEVISGSNTTHEWFFNNGTIPIATTPALILTNLSAANTGAYKLIVKLTDNCGNITQYDGTFNIEVFNAASATKPTDINFCDSDTAVPNDFDLATLKNTAILGGLDPAIFNVLYFDTLAKATANLAGSDLPNPYQVNTPSTQTIFARVHNRDAPDACFAITEFELEVTNNPIPVQPTVFRSCDDTASTSDTDTINFFRLDEKDTEILGTLNPSQYNVSYHTSRADALISSTTNAIDKTSDYPVTLTQRIFVRVENRDDVACNAISDDTAGSTFTSFEIIVDPLPIIKTNPVILKQCDDDTDLRTTFNLTEAEISVSDNRANETFEYYATQADAIAGTPQVADKLRYPVNNMGEAWVRTISTFNCYRISKIELIVSFAADVNYNTEFVACDDFLDADGNDTAANSDTDGITSFNFSDASQEVINLFPPLIQPNLEVLYYQTIADRTASINEIADITNHRNNSDPTFANNQTIYIRIKNKVNNDCTGIGQLFLRVTEVPIANTPTNFDLCDDALSGSTIDGKNVNIDLRNRVADILGTTQTEADYIVSFHTTAIGANTNADLITNDTSFTNTPQTGFTVGVISEQTIFVRVQDRNATPQCFNDAVSFKVIVNPIPEVATAITPLAVCDIPTATDADPRNRLAQNIDLTVKNIDILASRTNHRVAYYATQQHAVDGTPEIIDPTDFQNDPTQTTFPINFNTDQPGIQTIFFAVIEQGGNRCRSLFSTYQLLIYPEPNVPVNIADYSDCDNQTDTDQSDSNGRNGDIALINKIPEILANYQPNEFVDFSVTFYTSLANAQANDISLAIDENKFENITNGQTIFVRVENTKNTPIACIHTRLSFNINIKELPSFTVSGEKDIDDPLIVCVNNDPETPILLEAEDPATGYDYVWTDEIGTVLGNSSTIRVATAGEYTVTAFDRLPVGIRCSRARTIVVVESEKPTLLEEYVTIIDESNNISSQNNISVFIDTITNTLGKGDYQYALRNEDTGQRIPFIGFQDEPLFEGLEGGIYTIIVNDKNNCEPDAQLLISVIQFPKFFTPNADGRNDTWVVKGANKDFYPNTSMNIFNRFGKIVAQIPIDSKGWDGTYNGKLLPSDDYWFNVQLIPANPNKPQVLKKGHFSLLRR